MNTINTVYNIYNILKNNNGLFTVSFYGSEYDMDDSSP